MKTEHKLFFKDSRELSFIETESVNLVVTSPPYPMIEMWDNLFFSMNPQIESPVKEAHGAKAFEMMHKQLDRVWEHVARVLKPGGIICINIGDATRKIGDSFQLYSNHSRIISYFMNHSQNIVSLPSIIWRKSTNAPSKFMGSGMLPGCAYITLEHEFILVFRKGENREFKTVEEKKIRRQSAYFWEERNNWFSDLWNLSARRQGIVNSPSRNRNAAFPFELAYRLINMFSIYSDCILDPFLGTGTSILASMCLGRNSIGVELDEAFAEIITDEITRTTPSFNRIMADRFKKHKNFVREREGIGKPLKHSSSHYGFPVVTAQEKEMLFYSVKNINFVDNIFHIEHDIFNNENLMEQTGL